MTTKRKGLQMRAVRGWWAAAMVLVMVAASGSAPVSAGVVVPEAPSVMPSALSGDFNGDGRADVALVGASGWNGVATALSTGAAGFTANYSIAPAFAAWASLPEVKLVTGRFGSDLNDDILLTGAPGWTSLKLARSNGNGSFTVTEPSAGSFPAWAGASEARVLSGDFNGDGRTDLALAGGAPYSTIPVAMANADGTFTVTNNPAPLFAGRAGSPNARVYADDFNADGRTDLVLVPWDEFLSDENLTVAYSTGSGGFTEVSVWLPDFVRAAGGRTVIAGNFNYDNRADLAVVLPDRILVAYSLGVGNFASYRAGATQQFYLRANEPGARVIGTVNCGGHTDLVVISAPESQWSTLPVAMPTAEEVPTGLEEFFVMDEALPYFVQRSGGGRLLLGDYDGDGCEDLAATGTSGLSTVLLAISSGDGSYIERDVALPTFAAWATGASPVQLPAPPAETLGTLSFLDTGVPETGLGSSMTVGIDGLGLISYYVGATGYENLRVAHCEDIACTTVTTTDIDTAGDVGGASSIKIGSDGLPLISYVHYRTPSPVAFTEDLKVAHCNNIACTSATITTLDAAARVRDLTSLAIGADGLGLIAYQDRTSSTGTKMKVAHCLNVACTAANLINIDTVQPDGDYGQIGLAVGNHGMGLISYLDGGTNQMLKVAACTNADCTTTVKSIVDRRPAGTTNLHGGWTSLAFGLDGLALISYNGNYSASGSNLKIAHCRDVYCTTSTIITADTGGYVGWRPSTAVGADGLGIVSYYDITNRDLKMAHCNDLACGSATTTTVDAFDDVGRRSSVTIGPDGLPLVSYEGPGFLGTILRVIHCGNAACTALIVAPF